MAETLENLALMRLIDEQYLRHPEFRYPRMTDWLREQGHRVIPRDYADGHSLYSGLKRFFAYYNDERRHSSLGKRTPAEVFASGGVH